MLKKNIYDSQRGCGWYKSTIWTAIVLIRPMTIVGQSCRPGWPGHPSDAVSFLFSKLSNVMFSESVLISFVLSIWQAGTRASQLASSWGNLLNPFFFKLHYNSSVIRNMGEGRRRPRGDPDYILSMYWVGLHAWLQNPASIFACVNRLMYMQPPQRRRMIGNRDSR